ncbi:MAG: hypothetical protein ACI9U1_001799, partial [Porticoccaceae bacterium]
MENFEMRSPAIALDAVRHLTHKHRLQPSYSLR